MTHVVWHLRRMERTLENVGRGIFCIEEALSKIDTKEYIEGVWRMTIEYSAETVLDVRWANYTVPHIKNFKLFEVGEDLDYSYKYADRTMFEEYVAQCAEGECPLFMRNGLLTDTHFSNVVLKIDGKLLTPRVPLLEGTARARLLAEGMIEMADLKEQDLMRAEKIYVLNAMNDLTPQKLPSP